MDISEKLKQCRHHITIRIVVLLSFSLVLYVVPHFLTILAYFWPLFASTTFFMVAIIAFRGISKLSTEDHGEKVGEGILDYVVGRVEHIHEAQTLLSESRCTNFIIVSKINCNSSSLHLL
ncbi:hypothetical protein V8G54_037223 [Vigna mungo]|uniref:Uncharacterized protein n=1 Tax=Vigna mungo TaxID=3915 RepID=A0AAQ3MJW3_VIGMU